MEKAEIDALFDHLIADKETTEQCSAQDVIPIMPGWNIKLMFTSIPPDMDGDLDSLNQAPQHYVVFTNSQDFEDLKKLHEWRGRGIISMKIRKVGGSLFIDVAHNEFCTLRRFEDEQLAVFENPNYRAEVSAPENAKHKPESALLPDIEETKKAANLVISDPATNDDDMQTLRAAPGNDHQDISIPGPGKLPIIPETQNTKFYSETGEKVYRLNFMLVVIQLESDEKVIQTIRDLVRICKLENLAFEYSVDEESESINITITQKDDVEYGETLKQLDSAYFLEDLNPEIIDDI